MPDSNEENIEKPVEPDDKDAVDRDDEPAQEEPEKAEPEEAFLDEDRLVTLILVALLVLGLVGLAAFYFTTSGHEKRTMTGKYPGSAQVMPPESALGKSSDVTLRDRKAAAPGISPIKQKQIAEGDDTARRLPSGREAGIAPEEAVASVEEKRSQEIHESVTEKQGNIPSAQGTPEETSEPRTGSVEESVSPGLPGPPDDRGAKPEEEEAKAAAPGAVSPEPSLAVIREQARANGTFFGAQKVTEGIIVGKRGTRGDRADIYKIHATGNRMVLTLDPFLSEEGRRFYLTVFDQNRKPIGSISSRTGPTVNLNVAPDRSYYIMLDLSKAPIGEPEYRVSVHFK